MATCLDFAKLACATYYTSPAQYYETPAGYMVDDWRVQKFEQGTLFGDGYQGAIYMNERDVVVSCCGTNPGQAGKLLQDLVADIKIGLRMIPSQARSARDMVRAAKAIAGSRRRVSVTGPSLGGALAQVCAVQENVPFVTFNAPAMQSAIAASNATGMSASFLNSLLGFTVKSASQLPPGRNPGLNFKLATDRVSTHALDNGHIGVCVDMPNILNENGLLGAHGVDGCWQAILASDWSHINPFEVL